MLQKEQLDLSCLPELAHTLLCNVSWYFLSYAEVTYVVISSDPKKTKKNKSCAAFLSRSRVQNKWWFMPVRLTTTLNVPFKILFYYVRTFCQRTKKKCYGECGRSLAGINQGLNLLLHNVKMCWNIDDVDVGQWTPVGKWESVCSRVFEQWNVDVRDLMMWFDLPTLTNNTWSVTLSEGAATEINR